ncbi:MAG: methylenetetrahydrofolate--tRNA-(uracil(54)-C(5))-methyltransferase (FADH(2)-oxidizing) TrmFO [Candidatus Melainabacteria bacterium]|nr:methylenetetrahydrofolate--tRNA-(uracil(54)-C(5))-methyltransferase (FADH(2)-oxidizing) TrmFO [Candidatus Melainabacteria bacterium]
MVQEVKVIGAGLAGTEAAWQLAQAGVRVKLYEMRPKVKTPAHHTDNLAELVCSNSLGSEFLTTARGVLIHEMESFDSLIIKAAKHAKVPAGQALAVDRDLFAEYITKAIGEHPNIELIREEYRGDLSQEEGLVVVASGPLTSEYLAENISDLLKGHCEELATKQSNAGAKSVNGIATSTSSPRNDGVCPQDDSPFLHFFDAASPIVEASSINMDIAFKASRYGKGETADYINCPFYEQEDFDKFYEALMAAERAPLKDFEQKSIKYFEGCMPIEAIAERGKQTMCFGPLKPVGLTDPRYPERKAVAVVQLRQDNVVGSLYNIVGFQTNLKWGEPASVFSMIPGLENLEILRYGVMHQNIFINSPLFLNSDMSMRSLRRSVILSPSGRQDPIAPQNDKPNIYFAGQITGVEGYTESAATGIVAARSILSGLLCSALNDLPRETMMGALSNYVANADPKHFQPINSNWGLINTEPENLEKKYRKNKKLRQEYLANRALKLIAEKIAEKSYILT